MGHRERCSHREMSSLWKGLQGHWNLSGPIFNFSCGRIPGLAYIKSHRSRRERCREQWWLIYLSLFVLRLNMGELCFHSPFHSLMRYLTPQNFPSISSAIETLLHFCAEPLCFASYYKRSEKKYPGGPLICLICKYRFIF